MELCRLCRLADATTRKSTQAFECTCKICGAYRINLAAYNILTREDALAYLVAFWVSEQGSLGLVPLVDETMVEEIRSRPTPTARRRAERYLAAAIGLSDGKLFGTFSPVNPILRVASHSFAPGDAVALAHYWVSAGAFEVVDRSSQQFRLLAKGHFILDEMSEQRTNSTQCFVAMSFSDKMDTLYQDGIRPAVQASGYEPLRLDKKDYDGKVDDQIIAEIRRSAFLVADFTEHRGGVYYEAGFAHGMGRRVIFTCRKDDVENLHFDVRQYNTITWSKPVDLVDPLRNRILALFGSGPLKPDANTTT